MVRSNGNNGLAKVWLLGIKINPISRNQLLNEISTIIKNSHKAIISYVNIHAINLAYKNPKFRNCLNESYLSYCDGFGLLLGVKVTGQEISYRFTPPDFFEKMCEMAELNGWRMFFLGAKPGVAKAAAEVMISKYPGLEIATHHGYFDKTLNGRENNQIIEQINFCKPQILVLGFGMPLQEHWIAKNLESLSVNVLFPAGALFDYSGCSMVVAPYSGASGKIVGAIGVIGPTRINYARIIPMVDYTAKVVGRLLG